VGVFLFTTQDETHTTSPSSQKRTYTQG